MTEQLRRADAWMFATYPEGDELRARWIYACHEGDVANMYAVLYEAGYLDETDEVGSFFSKIAHSVSKAAHSAVHSVTDVVTAPVRLAQKEAATALKIAQAVATFHPKDLAKAIKDGGKEILSDPSFSVVQGGAALFPGIGTLASAGMAGAAALGQGMSIKDIGLAAARGALPPGPAQTAFDIANGLAHGQSLSAAALLAARNQIPDVARPGFDAGLAAAQSVSEEASHGALRHAPPKHPRAHRAAPLHHMVSPHTTHPLHASHPSHPLHPSRSSHSSHVSADAYMQAAHGQHADGAWMRYHAAKMRGDAREAESLARAAGYRGGTATAQVGLSTIVMPSDVEALLKDLKTDADRLDAAWMQKNQTTPTTTPGWLDAFTGWNKDYAAIGAFLASNPSTYWGSTADQVDIYRQKLVAWQKTLGTFGGTLAGPPIEPPPETIPPGELVDKVSGLLYAGLGLGALFVGWKVWRG